MALRGTHGKDAPPSGRDDERKPQAPRSTIRACLIINPRAGRGGADLTSVLPILQSHGWVVDVQRKHLDGSGKDLARQAARDGCAVVVACGGDGTVHDVVNGLVGTDAALSRQAKETR